MTSEDWEEVHPLTAWWEANKDLLKLLAVLIGILGMLILWSVLVPGGDQIWGGGGNLTNAR